MFRIVCDPSSGSTELCLTEITRGGSQIFFVCLVGVWQRNFEPAVCVHGTTYVVPCYFRLLTAKSVDLCPCKVYIDTSYSAWVISCFWPSIIPYLPKSGAPGFCVWYAAESVSQCSGVMIIYLPGMARLDAASPRPVLQSTLGLRPLNHIGLS